jgi:hypothetical protein
VLLFFHHFFSQVDHELLDESSEGDDSDISEPDSDDDSSVAERKRQRLEKIREAQEKLERTRMLAEKFTKEKDPEDKTPQEELEEFIKEGIKNINKRAQKGFKKIESKNKEIRKMMRRAVDIAEVRVRKWYKKSSGNFKEVQRDMKVEFFRQYVAQQVLAAKEKAEREFYIIEKVRESWEGMGLEVRKLIMQNSAINIVDILD